MLYEDECIRRRPHYEWLGCENCFMRTRAIISMFSLFFHDFIVFHFSSHFLYLSFLDALASLDFKLSVSKSLKFFGFPVNQVIQVIQVTYVIQVTQMIQLIQDTQDNQDNQDNQGN